MTMGTAIIVWEKISGVGDMTAPTTKDNTNTCFRCEIKNVELIIPNLTSNKIINGNSKIKPKGSKNEITKDKYSPRDNMGCKSSVANPIKNFIPAGNTRI